MAHRLLGASLFAALAAGPALAQNAGSSGASAASSDQLSEIVVTAQFRRENLQTTPIAITAITSQMIEDRSMTNVEDVAADVPSTTLTKGGDIKGVELELEERLGGLEIDASGDYLDFKYTSIVNPPPTGVTLGMVTPFTPEWQGHAGIQYRIPLGSWGSVTPRLDADMFGGVVCIDLRAVGEIGDPAYVRDEHESVAVESQAVLERPRIANFHALRRIVTGVHLRARRHVPPVDARTGHQVMKIRLDACGAGLLFGCVQSYALPVRQPFAYSSRAVLE